MTTSKAPPMSRLHRVFAVIATAAALLAVASLGISRSHAEQARVIAPPSVDEAHSASAATSEIAVLAGGCFWGVQGVFQHVNGVTSAVSGYAGGDRSTAEYEIVSSGTTGHAESVRVTFDPRQISFGRILQIYFSVVHDPTELNRQGPDSGTQYRSEIFAQSPEQASVSKDYIAQLTAAHAFDAAIVTRVELNKPFFRAEGYHQDYLTLNPTQPYIAINDLPKVANLKRLFPDVYRADPVLVRARH